MERTDPIISYLRKEKVLEEASLKELIDRQRATGQSMLTVIKDSGLLDEDELSRIVAAANHIDFVNISPEDIDPMAAHLISYETATRHSLIPIRKEDGTLFVAMSSPLNLSIRDEIERKTGYRVVPLAATPSAIKQAIHYHFDVANVTRQAIVSMRLKDTTLKQRDGESKTPHSQKTPETPITKLVSSIISAAIDVRASDIHIEPQEPDMRVRYRVDGFLRDAIDIPSSAQLELISHLKIMADMDISEHRIPQDGHISTHQKGINYDLRVSSLPSVRGEKIVLRILEKNSNRWSLNNVVTGSEDNQKMRELASRPYGMLLVTGPTGSGKTTTLYALLKLLNEPHKNIVTVEDPVEYCLDGITQVQVRPKAGMTFAAALRSILRQDPDIILLGEIRDLETAEIAVSAAQTGHLVLSTLHTNDAISAIARLTDLGVPSFMVASALLGSVAQRLVRTLCPDCKKAKKPNKHERKLLADTATTVDTLHHGKGCNKCCQSGYLGRKSIYEILQVSPTIRKMIVKACGEHEIKEQAIAEGMRTLDASALAEVLNGTTTLDEVTRAVDLGRS